MACLANYNLALFGSLSIVVAHHMYSMPPLFSYRLCNTVITFTHHNWIGGFCIVGAGAHAALWFVITILQTITTIY
jgi:photosystem I P700 chlorophyll a apoprotein A1